MGTKTTRMCAWGAFVAMGFWIVGFFFVAGFVPPPSPSRSADEVAALFAEHGLRIRVGLMITAVGGALIGLWTAAMATFLKRIEGRNSPLTYVQITLGGLVSLEFINPIMTWDVAAFRPERAPEITQALDDLAWMPFIGLVYTAVVQAAVFAYAILSDRRPVPILPRWVGYVTVFDLFGMIPAGFLIYFKSGPMAWNGIFTFWLVCISYTTWVIVVTVAMLRNMHRLTEADEEVPKPALATALR